MSGYHHYIGLWGAQKENEHLKTENQELRSEWLQAKEENQKLNLRLGNIEKAPIPNPKATAARVVGYDPLPSYRSITLNRGSQDGVKKDQAVVAAGGVIGRVLKVSPNNSQVLLITDLSSAVDVLDEKTRARGTLVGLRKKIGLNRDRSLTKAEYVSGQDEIHPGDLLLTSGMDGVFPPGWPVGVVGAVQKDANGLFWQAEVEPYVEMTNLEEVLVLLEDNGQ